MEWSWREIVFWWIYGEVKERFLVFAGKFVLGKRRRAEARYRKARPKGWIWTGKENRTSGSASISTSP